MSKNIFFVSKNQETFENVGDFLTLESKCNIINSSEINDVVSNYTLGDVVISNYHLGDRTAVDMLKDLGTIAYPNFLLVSHYNLPEDLKDIEAQNLLERAGIVSQFQFKFMEGRYVKTPFGDQDLSYLIIDKFLRY